jgi:hypothetical protein
LNFQTRVRPLSGFDQFRLDQTSGFQSQGLKGNALMARLGQEWRKLGADAQQKYKRKAYALSKLRDVALLRRSKSVTHESESSIIELERSNSMKY